MEKLVELYCMFCGEPFMGPEPKMCCSGRECVCMGMPTEPVVCSGECYDKIMSGIRYIKEEFKVELNLNKKNENNLEIPISY
jgi:hypothetical protein